MTIRTSLSILFLVGLQQICAQTLSNQTITAGSSLPSKQLLRYTIAETVIGSGSIPSGQQLTMGFHQPSPKTGSTSTSTALPLEVSVYPNPFVDQLQIWDNVGNPLRLQLFDLQGRLLRKVDNTRAPYTLIVPHGVSSHYLLKIQDLHTGRQRLLKLEQIGM
ncbi:MAG: T9SS type A sorting domain-containing protein [Saprospiraceae bacterium]|nr:T9SS type A sorting domain-containing protein [Saprospiraceae bacterium]